MYKDNSQRYGLQGQCFANKNGTECRITQSEICEGVCVFHKTRKLLKEGRRAAFLRLAGLSPDEQRYIADKYYRGAQPWNKAVQT